MSKEVKKPAREVQKNSLDFYVYDQIKNGLSPQQISEKLGFSKQKIDYYITKLKALELVRKVSYGIWEVTVMLTKEQFNKEVQIKKSKVFSLGARAKPKTNLHALQIKFPIISGKIEDNDWDVKEKLKNWTPKYTKLDELGGLRVKNNNNKSITVWAESRNIGDVMEAHNLAYKMRDVIYYYFKSKHNVIVDHYNCQVKNLDVATEDENAESMRGKAEKFTLDLNKDAEKIFPKDQIRAKAWIDGTPYNFSAETNDLEWKREYLNMPFNIRDIVYGFSLIHGYNESLKEYNENVKLHMKVQEEQLKTQKMLQELVERLGK